MTERKKKEGLHKATKKTWTEPKLQQLRLGQTQSGADTSTEHNANKHRTVGGVS